MARLGVRRYADLIGRTELLRTAPAVDHWKARGVDLSLVLARPEAPPDAPRRRVRPQLSPLPGALDWDLIEAARDAIDHRRPVEGEFPIRNVNRTVGGLLSHWIAKVHGAAGLPPETIRFALRGSAGQSFGAWLAPGVELSLVGDANDYCGKGLSGGVLSIRPPEAADVPGRGERDRRQHRALRRDRGPRVLPRPRRGALRRAQLGRGRRGGGRRRPRLRVHDRRPRGRARADRAQLRRGHERRRRLRARSRRRLRDALQPRARRLRRDRRGGRDRAVRPDRGAPPADALAASRRASSRTGRDRCPGS